MICCVNERPIRRDGNNSHDNSVHSTCPWSWSVTLPGKPTYVRRRRPLLLVERLQQQRLLHFVLLVVHEYHSVGQPSLDGAVGWNIPRSPHPPNHARLWRHWLVGKTFKAVRFVSVLRCAPLASPIHSPSSLRSLVVEFTRSDTL